MNRMIIVDITSIEKNKSMVTVQEVNKSKQNELIPSNNLNQIELMSALCEAISMLIHSANKTGVKKDYKSVEDCIKHIQNGFSDTSYVIK